jgi:hypothetical protein
MATVTITIQTTPVALPTGVAAGALRVSLLSGGAEFASQDVDGTEAVFLGIPDGEYTASAVRLDDVGGELSTRITQDFTVDAVTETYEAPSGLSVSVTPDVA